MKKKMIVGLLGISLVSMPLTAFADDVMLISANDEVATKIEANQVENYVFTTGQITDIYTDSYGMQVTVKTNDGGELVLNCGENTIIADATTGAPLDLNDRINDEVLIYHDIMMTMSIPAQTPAIAILGNVTEKSNLTYAVVEEVVAGKDGAVTVVTDNGSKYITIASNTRVTPFVTRNIVTASDITVGSQLLLGYDVITLSEPAMANAERVILLSQGEEADVAVEMMPLRSAAESMGYAVEWNNGKIVLTKDDVTVKLEIGNETAERNGQPLDLLQAPELRGNISYVPADLLDLLK